MPRIAINIHIEFHGAEIRSNNTRSRDAIAIQRQLLQLRPEVPQIQSQVQQRTDCHVTADSREAIEVKRPHTAKYYHAGKW